MQTQIDETIQAIKVAQYNADEAFVYWVNAELDEDMGAAYEDLCDANSVLYAL